MLKVQRMKIERKNIKKRESRRKWKKINAQKLKKEKPIFLSCNKERKRKDIMMKKRRQLEWNGEKGR